MVLAPIPNLSAASARCFSPIALSLFGRRKLCYAFLTAPSGERKSLVVWVALKFSIGIALLRRLRPPRAGAPLARSITAYLPEGFKRYCTRGRVYIPIPSLNASSARILLPTALSLFGRRRHRYASVTAPGGEQKSLALLEARGLSIGITRHVPDFWRASIHPATNAVGLSSILNRVTGEGLARGGPPERTHLDVVTATPFDLSVMPGGVRADELVTPAQRDSGGFKQRGLVAL